jgi:hypothetical protein
MRSFSERLAAAREALIGFDTLDLRRDCAAPADEWDDEARQITAQIDGEPTPAMLAIIVSRVLGDALAPHRFTALDCAAPAATMYALLREADHD